ncbi:hypothetical protein Pelo_3380 [Pelomyxa schiedti]|nr:hypothetical protein Pelo_3380 [Pelomyxa schiedti]
MYLQPIPEVFPLGQHSCCVVVLLDNRPVTTNPGGSAATDTEIWSLDPWNSVEVFSRADSHVSLVRALLESLTGAPVCVTCFSDYFQILCPFTADKAELIVSLDRISPSSPRPKKTFSDAFSALCEMLSHSQVAKGLQPIVVTVSALLEQCRGQVIPNAVFCNVPLDGALLSTATPALPTVQAFCRAHFELRSRTRQNAPARLTFFHNHDAGLTFISDPLSLRFSLEPVGRGSIAQGAKVYFKGSKHFAPMEVVIPQPISGEYAGELNLMPNERPLSGKTGCPELLFMEFSTHEYADFRVGILPSLSWMLKDFFTYKPLNVLLWGISGSGKSSLINGMASLFSSSSSLVSAVPTTSNGTQAFSSWSMKDFVDGSHPPGCFIGNRLNLKFWDTWGVSDGSYTKLKIVDFLNGLVPNNTPKVDVYPAMWLRTTKPKCPMDAVIFVIPLTEGLPGSCSFEHFVDVHVRAAVDAGYKPIVVCNFSPVFGCNEASSPLLLRIFKKLHSIGMQAEDLFLLENYTSEAHRVRTKDMQYHQ